MRSTGFFWGRWDCKGAVGTAPLPVHEWCAGYILRNVSERNFAILQICRCWQISVLTPVLVALFYVRNVHAAHGTQSAQRAALSPPPSALPGDRQKNRHVRGTLCFLRLPARARVVCCLPAAPALRPRPCGRSRSAANASAIFSRGNAASVYVFYSGNIAAVRYLHISAGPFPHGNR